MLLNGEALEIFEAAVEQITGASNITTIWFKNNMRQFMSDMCPDDLLLDITSWLQNLL